jgi:hypothetical protein
LSTGCRGEVAHRNDLIVINANIGVNPGIARTINDLSIQNQYVEATILTQCGICNDQAYK